MAIWISSPRYAPASLLAAVAVAVAPAHAQTIDEEVLVTGTRSGGISRFALGSSVTVLDSVDIEERQVRIVSDVLRDIPGVAVSRAGTVGGLTQVRLRGTEGNHVLVLIDGMEAADPSQGEFDFATLIADEVARIEVLRGQQSAVYGSDAIGGVIHYITPGGREAPGVRSRVEAGSFGTQEAAARFGGGSDTFGYAVSLGHHTTDGVPTAREGEFGGQRNIGAELSALSAKLDFDPTERTRVRTVLRYSHTEADVNDQNFDSEYFGRYPYGYVVDTDGYYENDLFLAMVRVELDSLGDRWTHAVALQRADTARDGYSGGVRSYGNEGARTKLSYESVLRFGHGAVDHTFTSAVDLKREEMQNTGPNINASQALKRRIDNRGLVAQYDVLINGKLGVGAAYRYDDNDRFDNAGTFRVQTSYMFDSGTRIRAAAGSGIKNPTMTELFGFNPDSFIGNPDLKPERSRGWEVGVEQDIAGGAAMVGLSYFDSKLKDEVYTVFTPEFVSTPANRATDSTQSGVELFASARVGDRWRFDLAYTDLDAKEDGFEEVRRPPSIASVNVGWRTAQSRGGVNLTLRYNGDVLDLNFTGVGPDRIRLPAYTLVNLAGDWMLSDRLQLYGRIENAFDKEYEDVYTFRTPGRGTFVGLRARF